MKKLAVTSISSAIVLLSASASVFASAPATENNKVTIIIDEQAGTEKGLILNDSPLLPLRAIVTQLGVSNDDKHIIWNAEEKSVTIIKDTNEYHLKIGSNQALINKTPITMPETTVLENGLTYIPAAFIEKSLSDHVSWEPSEKRVNITSSNSEKAVAVLKSLETGDTQAIKRFISPVTYIQHNLAFPDGRDGLLQGLEFLKAAGFKINIQRVIVDGDYVAVHSGYELNGAKAGFDIFRFENGKIVEHWDNLQEMIAPNPSAHTLLDGATEITDLNQTDANKALVKKFVEDVLMGQHPERIAEYFNGDHYMQHNPFIADGLSSLGQALQDWAKQGITLKIDKVHMVIGQGNFVLVVSEGALGGKHTSFYDLFRVENGKIAEHWDILETIPDQAQWKNSNGKF